MNIILLEHLLFRSKRHSYQYVRISNVNLNVHVHVKHITSHQICLSLDERKTLPDLRQKLARWVQARRQRGGRRGWWARPLEPPPLPQQV